MESRFSGCEIVEIGVQIERNGRDFYSVLAGSVKDARAADIFRYLAEAEDRHIEVFRRIFDSSCRYEPEGAFTDEYFAYMRALADQYVFTRKDKGRQIAESVKSDEEGIEIAIRSEKDSILFYQEMKKAVPEKDWDLVDKVISEEREHLEQLCGLKGGCTYEEGKSI